MHVGEAVAAVVARQPGVGAGPVGMQVELRRHAVHRVDHAAEPRDEEGVHHAGRGQREMDRHPGGDHQLVDAGDVLLGIDEQPLPVERHDLDLERGIRRPQRLGRVEIVRADPGDAAQQDDGQQRDRPDDQLELPRIGEVGPVARPQIGGAVPPGEAQDDQDDRHDDRQHDGDRIDQEGLVALADRPLRIEHPTARRQGTRGEQQGPTASRPGQRSNAGRQAPPMPQSRRLGRHTEPLSDDSAELSVAERHDWREAEKAPLSIERTCFTAPTARSVLGCDQPAGVRPSPGNLSLGRNPRR